MAICIYKESWKEQIAVLDDNIRDLATLLDTLEKWLLENKNSLQKDHEYFADIGFTSRRDAGGGGPILSLKMMKMLLECNMEIYFSEYPPDELSKYKTDFRKRSK